MSAIAYRAGYKYQLVEDFVCSTPIRPPVVVSNRYIRLHPSGDLTIRADYAWDGPSGPAIDTPNFMRPSLVHDAFYQLMREELLPANVYREKADRLLQVICREDGMSAIRAWWVYQGVRLGGGPAADAAFERPVLRAP